MELWRQNVPKGSCLWLGHRLACPTGFFPHSLKSHFPEPSSLDIVFHLYLGEGDTCTSPPGKACVSSPGVEGPPRLI